jgi:hypothetical protein
LLLTKSEKNNAQVWWNRGRDNLKEWTEAPIMISDYRDTEFCPGYKGQK